jgi:phosphohistidine phosphatase
MRDHAARIGLAADLVLVSPARRAQQTWERVAPGVGAGLVRTEAAIYEATVETLLDLVRGTPGEVRSLLLVGHDPGFHQLAASLAGDGVEEELTALRSKYPTGALATLTFDLAWSEVAADSGRLVSFVRPRELLN